MTADETFRRAAENGRTLGGPHREKVIIDGDWAGDEMQLAAVLLNHPDRVEVLGATAVFGNTDLEQVAVNGRNILHFLNADHIPCYPGAKCPSGMTEPLEGDGAHGAIDLPKSPAEPQTKHAVDFMLETLENSDPDSVTIIAVGPLTNIAQALQKAPETMRRVKRLVVMGGCTEDMPAHDMPTRRGNISPEAEFNFQQAPQDAQDVMNSGLPITLIPMNCTHQMAFTPARQAAVTLALPGMPEAAKAIHDMMMSPADYDRTKFDSDPVMHDVHCALYLLYPEAYETRRGEIAVETICDSKQGRTDFTANSDSPVTVATGLGDADKLFDIVLQSMAARVTPSQAPRITVVGSCVMDLVAYGTRAPEAGETVFGKKFETGFGGKGANQAVAAALCGASVAMVSCVGNDQYGRDTIKNFRARGIDTSGIATIPDMTTGVAPIFVNILTGENRIVVVPGANDYISPGLAQAALEGSPKPDAIIMQCEMPLETIYRTTRYARENDIISILNVAPAAPVDLELLDGLDYLVVNESEAEAISGNEVADSEDAERAGQKLLASSNIGKIIVTLGNKGAVLIGREETLYAEPFLVKPVDTSGAGDAWLGCFSASIVQGHNEQESMRKANLFAAMSVLETGTQKSYPALEEFTRMAAEVFSQGGVSTTLPSRKNTLDG